MLSLSAAGYKNLSAGQCLLQQPDLVGFITSASSRLFREAKEALPAACPHRDRAVSHARHKPQKGICVL